MTEAEFTVATLVERPDLTEPIDAVAGGAWPLFMLQDPVAAQFWGQMVSKYPQHQFALLDAAGNIAAMGNSIPLHWTGPVEDLPGRGWDWVMRQGCADHDAGRTPSAPCARSPGRTATTRWSPRCVRTSKRNTR